MSANARGASRPSIGIFLQNHRWWLLPLLWMLASSTAAVVLVVSLGIAQRSGWIGGRPSASAPSAAEAGTIYTCPMHPQIRSPQPGRCPICGMALEPATGSGEGDILAVEIEPAARRIAGIETAAVRRADASRRVRAVGEIQYDEGSLSRIVAYADGRVERVFHDYTGVRVEKGEPMIVLFSPRLYTAQQAFLEAARAIDGGESVPFAASRRELYEAARDGLRELGMTDEQIDQVQQSGRAQTRTTIHAPGGGTVIEKSVVEGQDVKTGDTLFKLADLSTVWLMLELFPEEAALIRYGQQVVAEAQSLPGEKFTGRVAFIDPVVDPRRRTVGVRVVVPNPLRRLKIGEYATALIDVPISPGKKIYDADLAGKWISPRHPQIILDQPGDCPVCGSELIPTSELGYLETPVKGRGSLLLPRSAVLTAAGSSLVYVETKPGRFEIRPVVLGPAVGNDVVVTAGVKEGDQVATAGNFLIDSQMQLAGRPSLIDPLRAGGAAAPKASEQDAAPQIVGGEMGAALERLYAAYSQVQRALAADMPVTEQPAKALSINAEALLESDEVPAAWKEELRVIQTQSEHLHHQDLAGARKSFREISGAVIALAARARGEQAADEFVQYHCSMVQGGGADWLQAGGEQANPYFGSEMLRCGSEVRRISLPAGDHEHP